MPDFEEHLFCRRSAGLLEGRIKKSGADSAAARIGIDRKVGDLTLTAYEPRDNITEHRRDATIGHIADAREEYARMREHVAERALRPGIGKAALLDRGDRRNVAFTRSLHLPRHSCVPLSGRGCPCATSHRRRASAFRPQLASQPAKPPGPL